MNDDVLWQIVGGIIQSNSESAKSRDAFEVVGTPVNLPIVSERNTPCMSNTVEEECRNRKGITVINNKDNLCLPRVLVVAMAYTKKDPECHLIRMDNGKRQTVKAQNLMQIARVGLSEEGSGIPELEQFQELLKDLLMIMTVKAMRITLVMITHNLKLIYCLTMATSTLSLV